MPSTLRLTILSAALFASACATEPGRTTAVGAATGGVLGAGLGAVVGSQTGDPGSGFLLGAAAGTAAGATIGNSMQAQNEELEEREEIIQRQQHMLSMHRSQIEELRRMGQDNVSFQDRSQPTSPQNKMEPPPSQPKGVGISGGLAEVRSQKRGREILERDVMTETPAHAPSTTAGDNTVVQAPAPSFDPEKVAQAAKTEEHAMLPSSQVHSSSARPSSLFGSANTNPEPTPTPQPAAPTNLEPGNGVSLGGENRMASLGTKSDEPQSECGRAQEEVEKAKGVSEPADKLFHFRRALRLCPSNASYHVSLADLYLSLKRRADAEFEYKEALKIDPNLGEVKRKLEELKGN